MASKLKPWPITVLHGVTKRVRVTVRDGAGALVNLTGATIQVEVRDAVEGSDPALIALTVGSGVTILNQTTNLGQFEATWTATQTAGLSRRAYVWDVRIIDGTNEWMPVPPSDWILEGVGNQR